MVHEQHGGATGADTMRLWPMEDAAMISRFATWCGVLAVTAGIGLGSLARADGDGAIVGWGAQVIVAQSELAGVTAVAGGGQHSLGLKADGSIVAWGANYYGLGAVPPPNSGFVAVAAGMLHSLAVKTDGTVIAWGNNNYDQCEIPSPNVRFVDVAGGVRHSLALRADGSIAAWG
jgi:alpha-tubulin suppressor-like RCC1 family protein